MKRFKNILLIDDHGATNFYNKYILEESDWVDNIACADDTEDAVVLLQNLNDMSERIKPSLVFLDVNLPKYSGFELINRNEALIADLVKKGVKIFMLSSSQNPSDIELVAKTDLIEGFYEKPLTLDIIDEISQGLF
jgi:DNA-binding NarL/FixJ family response regulator